jgi:hypothetical protein
MKFRDEEPNRSSTEHLRFLFENYEPKYWCVWSHVAR